MNVYYTAALMDWDIHTPSANMLSLPKSYYQHMVPVTVYSGAVGGNKSLFISHIQKYSHLPAQEMGKLSFAKASYIPID